MPHWFYFDNSGTKQGPITAAQLKTLAQKGVVTSETLIETEQGKQAPAGKIQGLEFAPSVSVPPIPPMSAESQSTSTNGSNHANKFCTNCGSPVHEQAVACLQCGVPPHIEKNFCYHCGTKINNVRQVICLACGSSTEYEKVKGAAHLADKKPVDNGYLVTMHLGQFLNFLLPLIMFLVKREQDPRVDLHGKIIMNWWLNMIIYSFIAVPLCFIYVGIVLILLVIIAGIWRAIYGAIKASKGECYDYGIGREPLNFDFFEIRSTLQNQS